MGSRSQRFEEAAQNFFPQPAMRDLASLLALSQNLLARAFSLHSAETLNVQQLQ